MQFQAKLPDLDLEITTLNQEEPVFLKPKIIMNIKNVTKIVNKWSSFEKINELKKEEEQINSFELIAIELTDIYDVKAKWFIDNLDVGTLNQIIQYVANTMAGVKKKLET